jgi:hypothetical protein
VAVTTQFQLDVHELELLTQAAHTVDTMAALQRQVDKDGPLVKKDFASPARANPALVELRAQRAVYARLILALGLPVGVTGNTERPKGKRGRPTAFEAQQRGLRGVSGGVA